MHPLRSFPTQKKAEKWARAFDYGRACNGLPPLVVMAQSLEWIVYNPAPDQPAGPFRIPGGDPEALPHAHTPAVQEPLF